MWAEAVDLLERAERMQRQFFRLATGEQRPRWEPPVDVYSRGDEILIEVALPGVPSERVELVFAPGELIVRGERRLPGPLEQRADPPARDPLRPLRAQARAACGHLGAHGPGIYEWLPAAAAGPALNGQR